MHCRLRALDIEPRLKADADSRRFPYVVFSAPPSGSADYVGEASLEPVSLVACASPAA